MPRENSAAHTQAGFRAGNQTCAKELTGWSSQRWSLSQQPYGCAAAHGAMACCMRIIISRSCSQTLQSEGADMFEQPSVCSLVHGLPAVLPIASLLDHDATGKVRKVLTRSAAHLDAVVGGTQLAAGRKLQRVTGEDDHPTGLQRRRLVVPPHANLRKYTTSMRTGSVWASNVKDSRPCNPRSRGVRFGSTHGHSQQ